MRDEFLWNNPLDVRENVEHAHVFAFHSSRLFSVRPEPSTPFKHLCKALAFFAERLFNLLETKHFLNTI
jgi:hypothetical protein